MHFSDTANEDKAKSVTCTVSKTFYKKSLKRLNNEIWWVWILMWDCYEATCSKTVITGLLGASAVNMEDEATVKKPGSCEAFCQLTWTVGRPNLRGME